MSIKKILLLSFWTGLNDDFGVGLVSKGTGLIDTLMPWRQKKYQCVN
ncbi:MAG: hypothetical protein IKF83_04015 [Clostridia bacterium]|nr:hypothetical protein [Clostridia bacterium]